MKKYSKFFKIFILSFFIVLLSVSSINAAWLYFEGAVSSLNIDKISVSLAEFLYGPSVPRDDGYINDFPDPQPDGTKDESQNAFEQIMGDKKDDYTDKDVGLNNVNSSMNAILNNLKDGEMITSIDLYEYKKDGSKVYNENQGKTNRELYGVGSDVHFAIVKNSGDAWQKNVTVFTTNTQLYSDNADYINDSSKVIEYPGGFIIDVYRAEMTCFSGASNDAKFGYEIKDSKRGYCSSGYIPNNNKKPFFDPGSWQHGTVNGMSVKLLPKEKPTYDFNTSFKLGAYAFGGNKPINNSLVKWESNDEKYAKVSNGTVTIVKKATEPNEKGFVVTDDDLLKYNYQSIQIKATSNGKTATFAFKINQYPNSDTRGMCIDKESHLLTGGQPIDIDMQKSGMMYTNGTMTQGLMFRWHNGPIKFSLECIDPKMEYIFFTNDPQYAGPEIGKAYFLDLKVTQDPNNEFKKTYECNTSSIHCVSGNIEWDSSIEYYYLTITSRTPVRYELIS